MNMFRTLIAVSILLVAQSAVGQVGRKIVTDDAAGFGNTGWAWENYLPGGGAVPSPDVRNDGFGTHDIGFNLRVGTQLFGTTTPIYAYENGVLAIGAPLAGSAPSAGDSLSGLQTTGGNAAMVVAPVFADLHAAAPGTYPEYGTGEFHLGEVSLLSGSKLRADGAGGYLPATEADAYRGLRVSWFGLTAQPDSTVADPSRYFGQIDFLDVGTREDGDFDLLIRIGASGEPSAYPLNALGGFALGNQFYQFSAAAVNNQGWFDLISFRNGIAYATAVNGDTVTFGAADNAVPATAPAFLIIMGLLGLPSRQRRLLGEK
jgi:hypothetical protein